MLQICLLLPLLFSFSGLAVIDCPTYENLKSCLAAADLEYKRSHSLMTEYLHDKDNLTDRHYAFTSLNVTIPKTYENDKMRCQKTCTK